jgi:hypothetical protein
MNENLKAKKCGDMYMDPGGRKYLKPQKCSVDKQRST